MYLTSNHVRLVLQTTGQRLVSAAPEGRNKWRFKQSGHHPAPAADATSGASDSGHPEAQRKHKAADLQAVP